jgi:hypothetical protein
MGKIKNRNCVNILMLNGINIAFHRKNLRSFFSSTLHTKMFRYNCENDPFNTLSYQEIGYCSITFAIIIRLWPSPPEYLKGTLKMA